MNKPIGAIDGDKVLVRAKEIQNSWIVNSMELETLIDEIKSGEFTLPSDQGEAHYTIRRDESGYAAAIERDGYTVIQLMAGTERNEQEVQSIVDRLNGQHEATRLREALEKCFIGGNSLASVIINWMLPAGYEKWSYENASGYFYEKYDEETAYEYYETWLCWKSLMDARTMVEALSSPHREERKPIEMTHNDRFQLSCLVKEYGAEAIIGLIPGITEER